MKETIELLAQLIVCPSLTPNDAGCQEIIIERLKKAGFTCETMIFENVTNLWAKRGNGSPLVVFAGHTDVVPTGPTSDWSYPPFKAQIEQDYVYGRGAADMKGALAAMIVAAEKFLQQQPNFAGTLAFLLTSDEEGKGEYGTKKVIEALLNRGEKIDFCLIGEPSSIEKAGDQIRIGRRGSLHGKLVIHGKQGHVAHPHLADNPIHKSALILHTLSETEWDQGNHDFPPTSFQITNLHSGTGATNVIPGHLESLFNLRFSTAITPEEIKTKIKSILNAAKMNYEIEWNIGGEPFLTKRGSLVEAVVAAIKETTGIDTKLSTGGGTSDGRFIAPTGAEVVELGTSHATAHHVNECVKLEDIQTLTAIYQSLLFKLLKTT